MQQEAAIDVAHIQVYLYPCSLIVYIIIYEKQITHNFTCKVS